MLGGFSDDGLVADEKDAEGVSPDIVGEYPVGEELCRPLLRCWLTLPSVFTSA